METFYKQDDDPVCVAGYFGNKSTNFNVVEESFLDAEKLKFLQCV